MRDENLRKKNKQLPGSRRKDVDSERCLWIMRKIKLFRGRKRSFRDKGILNPKKSIQDLLRLRTKEEQMKWLIEKGDRDSSWTWWLRQLSRITNRSRKKRIKESLPSILLERRRSLLMSKGERIDFFLRELLPRITFCSRWKTKDLDSKKRKGGIRFRRKSGRKKQLNTLRPKSKKPRISEILIKNTPKSFYLCLKRAKDPL